MLSSTPWARPSFAAFLLVMLAACSPEVVADHGSAGTGATTGGETPPPPGTCPDGQVLSGDACVAACAHGLSPCDGACVDLATDPANCGACGTTCGPDHACDAGTCQCSAGKTACGDACVDTTTDAANCGACAHACAPTETCKAGTCKGPSSWPTLGYDERHTGYNPAETAGPPTTLAWSVDVDTQPLNPVVVDDGRVFVTSAASDQYQPSPMVALSVADGQPLWMHDFGDVFSVGAPSVAAGNVYVQHCNGPNDTKLWKLDAATGAMVWSASQAGDAERYWAPLVLGDAVYADSGGQEGGMVAFSLDTGEQLFFSDLFAHYDAWSPAYWNGLVFSFDWVIRAHDPHTGKYMLQWGGGGASNGWSMDKAPVLGDTLGYFTAQGYLYEFDPTNPYGAGKEADGNTFDGMPATADGVVYALDGGKLVALDGTTLTKLWTFPADGQLAYPPAIAAGYAYVSSAAEVFAVDLTTHKQVWSDSPGGWLSIANGKLFVARVDGRLAAYDLAP